MSEDRPAYVLDSSTTAPDREAWFALPAGFTTLPLDLLTATPGSPQAAHLREAVGTVLAAAPDDAGRQQLIARIATAQQMLLALRQEGTVHCSLGVHRDDDGDGRILTSLFTFRWQAIARAPRHLTAARAVAAGHDRVELLDLPSGPAALGETASVVAPDLGLPVDRILHVHAYVPHPDGRRLAVLSLGTGAADRRAHYRAVLHDVAEHVSFEDPLLQDAPRHPVSTVDKATRRTAPPRSMPQPAPRP